MTYAFALSVPLIFIGIFISLLIGSFPAIGKFGPSFIVKSAWDPVAENYGALPMIYGTLMSSLIALLIAVPLGLGTALLLSEVSHSKFQEYVARMVELLATIPSVIYGLWGIFVLGPVIVGFIGPFLQFFLGWTPFFQGALFGLNMLAGGIILAIMILPTVTAVSREVFQAVPMSLRESALALGTTKWEMLKLAVFGPARNGVIGAIILGLGRALGETMAITMVIGNRPEISPSLFAPGYTLASVIANEFAEANSPVYLSALIEIGLILMVITVIVNGLARYFVWRTTK
jgi:phosphate transport system permease protein